MKSTGSTIALVCWLGLGLVAGCGGAKDTPAGSGDMTAATADMSAEMCMKGCPFGCPSGQKCIQPSDASDFGGFCSTSCQTTSDCTDADFHCVEIRNETFGRVCAAWHSPVLCPNAGAWNCTPDAPACADANTLTAGLSWSANHICGTEYMHCPNGCVVSPVDGGTSSVAHCQ